MKPAFPLREMLQHFAHSGRTGKFIVQSKDIEGEIFLVNGLAVNAETQTQRGEAAFMEILSWVTPFYIWEEHQISPFITMDQTVQDMLLRHSLSGGAPVAPIISTKEARKEIPPVSTQSSIRMEIQSPEISLFSFFVRKSRILIGRDETSDLILSDTFVSIRHAVLITSQDGVIVQDLGSKNGTFIDGGFISRGIARIGQTIHLGRVRLDLHPA